MITERQHLLDAIRSLNEQGRPAALTFNTHITALAIARSLGRQGVPILALDREGGGLGQHSKYLSALALCPDVDDGGEAFTDFLMDIGPHFQERPVLFPTNDDWVFAVARHKGQLERFYRVPFSGQDVIDTALTKTALYRQAETLGIPIPQSWYLDQASLTELAAGQSDVLERTIAQVPYPVILKPDESRAFYEAFKAKVFVVNTPEEFRARVREAASQNLRLVAQRIIDTPPGGFYSVCSYLDANSEPRGVFVGRKLEQYPPTFGTSCLADSRWVPDIAQRGVQVLQALGFHGISEIEFVLDPNTGKQLLLDVNTRSWKWIGLPIASGIDLPLLAYQDAIGAPFDAPQQQDGIRWTFLRDYVKLVRERSGVIPEEHVTREEWLDLISGQRPAGGTLVDGILDPDDPAPFYDVLKGELFGFLYACAC
ncbi:ATP-grasp family protein [Deinococcus peraridilitoris]|uniref:Putative ATP-grasp enzyme n=1 Tax=Deinococcus peraridilitoris (strain DSM 19664 / LMG 22246 / CIP 109416 / KR-200) TaxID=937777 RepID=L0A950_DEIPD|nr:ATP-grasp family protein [Deinococcus peraridilitoris]AFZ69647.1 putative ATP-grasp enzyme [Deinococcus peraridilitoris DSM 19664]